MNTTARSPAPVLASFSSRTVRRPRGFLPVLAALVVAWLAWQAVQPLLLAFAGLLFAVFLDVPTAWLTRHTRLSRRLAFGLVFVTFLIIVAGGSALLAPTVGHQIDRLLQSLPGGVEAVRDRLAQYGWGQRLVSQATGSMGAIASRVTSFLGLLGSGLGALVVVFFIGVFVAAEPSSYAHGVVRLVPLERRELAGRALGLAGHTLRLWLAARLFSMAVTGLLTWLGLWLLGIPLAAILGLLAALLTFVPYLGPILSAIPGILLGLATGPMLALQVAGLYLLVQTIESYVLTPLVQRSAVSLPPALLLLTQVVAGTLFGALGVVLAGPMAALGLTLVRFLWIGERLGDRIEPVPP